MPSHYVQLFSSHWNAIVGNGHSNLYCQLYAITLCTISLPIERILLEMVIQICFTAQKFQHLSNMNETFIYGKSFPKFPKNVFLHKSYTVLVHLNAPFLYDQ